MSEKLERPTFDKDVELLKISLRADEFRADYQFDIGTSMTALITIFSVLLGLAAGIMLTGHPAYGLELFSFTAIPVGLYFVVIVRRIAKKYKQERIEIDSQVKSLEERLGVQGLPKTLKLLKNRFADLTKDERASEKDLEKLLDSMLDSDVWGVIIGALFGGLVTALLAAGVGWLTAFNIILQPVTEGAVIFIVAVGLVAGILVALYAASEASMIIRTRLMKQYLDAREIIRARASRN